MSQKDGEKLKTDNKYSQPFVRKPEWLRRPMAFRGRQNEVERKINSYNLHTVCSEARCPNRSECHAMGTATFLVMGAICTRNCSFCSVAGGIPEPLDWNEIGRVVAASGSMGLRHVVITSVTRDDLPDGGGSFFACLVAEFRKSLPDVTVELLIPDLAGNMQALEKIFASKPDVLNHNIETVPSLYKIIRPEADYRRSLAVLAAAADHKLIVKSGMMVGLGEDREEVFSVLEDLTRCGCSIVTIGQYLQPSLQQNVVIKYIAPEQFERYAEYGRKIGLKRVVAGPFVRSSYHAAEVISQVGV